MGTRDELGGRVSEAADSATSRVREVGSEVTDMPEMVADQTRGAPIIAGSIAFGLGALLALLLPETEAEHHVADKVQPQLAAATDAAKDAGRQALATAQEASQGAIEELKESAAEHASEVAQQAKGASEQVKETAQEAAGPS
jgi:gas vesicle protein